MGALIFVGSYFGIWRKNKVKLPWLEVGLLFVGAWVLAALLLVLFQLLLSGQNPDIRATVGTLWGPLVVGVLLGRKVTAWRRNVMEARQSGPK